MTTFDAHTVRTWRDLDQDLTEAQFANFEEQERQGESQDDLVIEARYAALANFGDRIFFGHLPIPDGATSVSRPDNEAYEGRWVRNFAGEAQEIGDEGFDQVRVQVTGTQFSSGEETRQIEFSVEGGDEPDDYSLRHLDPTLARTIAHMLLNAANEIEPEVGSVSTLKARLEKFGN